ncbi:DUF6115 domain-containing protein [Clostridium estertheticum]|uniref:Uncharacterized protein n=1 Tax=Clostridium estertheticum subsp. estertheticum TaxID=1552 RepID=A0A1J0GII5_9CLOT|nr:hypothetical protein [Clostridium estertheticum]APC41129.1 hypothetical protein A7L45_14130 [Clostridium estertheticum subsp. estertheticum]MBU3074136.1 hypothetical protein [Clostridium estertheticum]MBU3164230.1 hypothetical protein [Clostridium estertheticum]MBU3186045.1 hypothetical protein [Clostridium estertheticum]MBX4265203.1 hypothetical protein [Clostridium estertheticum]
MTGLLIFIGLILIILNVLSIKKQNKSFNGVLGNAMGNIKDDDIRIGEIRAEFSESILELQSEIMEIKEIMAKNNKIHKDYEVDHDNKENSITIDDIKQENTNITYIAKQGEIDSSILDKPHNNSNKKVEEIKRLFSEGSSTDEVCEILHLGKGEVLLIKDLYIK